MRWELEGEARKIKPSLRNFLDGIKWKKRGDLLQFATKNPGALTAHFLAGVHLRLSKGQVEHTKALKRVSVAGWADEHSGLSEVRDRREVATLAAAMDRINRSEVAEAMGILCQRIQAIQRAKTKGSSWEKAEAIELIPSSGASLAPSAMISLA